MRALYQVASAVQPFALLKTATTRRSTTCAEHQLAVRQTGHVVNAGSLQSIICHGRSLSADQSARTAKSRQSWSAGQRQGQHLRDHTYVHA